MKPLLCVGWDHPLAAHRMLGHDAVLRYSIIGPGVQGSLVAPIFEVMTLLGGDPLNHLHIIENHPIVAWLVEQSDAIGVVFGNSARPREFSRRFTTLDFAKGAPIPMCLARSKQARNNVATAKP